MTKKECKNCHPFTMRTKGCAVYDYDGSRNEDYSRCIECERILCHDELES